MVFFNFMRISFFIFLNFSVLIANGVGLNQTPRSAAYDHGQHYPPKALALFTTSSRESSDAEAARPKFDPARHQNIIKRVVTVSNLLPFHFEKSDQIIV